MLRDHGIVCCAMHHPDLLRLARRLDVEDVFLLEDQIYCRAHPLVELPVVISLLVNCRDELLPNST